MEHTITEKHIADFSAYLRQEEYAAGTAQKYLHEIQAFFHWKADREITKELIASWKEHLCQQGKTPGTVNGCIAALHGFLAFLGKEDCRVKYLKIQKKMFRDVSKELTQEEYLRLVETARSLKKSRLALLLETICATGVRVSEVKYITVEAARRGRTDISLKGKIRTILIPNKLARKLTKYAQKQKIASGEIFITKSGSGLSRRQIWGEMKRLCKAAKVDESKVFPHNLRHLFARAFYKASRDIVKLADVLGHSSIETTRIYLITTGAEHARQLERLGFIT